MYTFQTRRFTASPVHIQRLAVSYGHSETDGFWLMACRESREGEVILNRRNISGHDLSVLLACYMPLECRSLADFEVIEWPSLKRVKVQEQFVKLVTNQPI